MLCAPRANGYSAANSSTRLDSTQFCSGTSGCVVVFVFLVVDLPWSCLSAVESFNSLRSAEVGGRAGFARCTSRKKVGFAWPPTVSRYATRYMGTGVLGYMVTRAQAQAACGRYLPVANECTVRNGPRGHRWHLWPLVAGLSGQC